MFEQMFLTQLYVCWTEKLKKDFLDHSMGLRRQNVEIYFKFINKLLISSSHNQFKNVYSTNQIMQYSIDKLCISSSNNMVINTLEKMWL